MLDEEKRGGILVARKAALLVELESVLANLKHVLDKRPVRLLAGVAVDRTVLPLDIEAHSKRVTSRGVTVLDIVMAGDFVAGIAVGLKVETHNGGSFFGGGRLSLVVGLFQGFLHRVDAVQDGGLGVGTGRRCHIMQNIQRSLDPAQRRCGKTFSLRSLDSPHSASNAL